MPPDGDPYLYPGTTTLKNKLGLRDPAALERAQDERAAARYAILERNLPQPPFTFDTLKDVHKQLFGSVYDWAGQPRTIGIQKADWNDAGGKLTTFANPATIAPMASVAFKAIDNGRALMNLDRQAFAAGAAEFLNDLNIIHPFRGQRTGAENFAVGDRRGGQASHRVRRSDPRTHGRHLNRRRRWRSRRVHPPDHRRHGPAPGRSYARRAGLPTEGLSLVERHLHRHHDGRATL
jgi:fido (protein-threonine AMPylation protein)